MQNSQGQSINKPIIHQYCFMIIVNHLFTNEILSYHMCVKGSESKIWAHLLLQVSYNSNTLCIPKRNRTQFISYKFYCTLFRDHSQLVSYIIPALEDICTSTGVYMHACIRHPSSSLWTKVSPCNICGLNELLIATISNLEGHYSNFWVTNFTSTPRL